MIRKKELDIIKNRFKRYIEEAKISKPKPSKKSFFKKKSEDSLRLANFLLKRKEYLDWVICIAYYSMFYNAISLLAHNGIDLEDIDDSIHSLTYHALIYYFYIQSDKIEITYLDEFRDSMDKSDIRLKNLAKERTKEIIASYKNARAKRGKISYELGETAKISSAKTAIRRAESFDILVHKLMID